MASAVLFQVGNVILPGVGGIIGGLIGAGIDLYIKNVIFKKPKALPPDDTFRPPEVDEGAGVPWVLGSRIRIPGQVIWLRVREPHEEVKNKSGGPTPVDHYTADIAIAWCRNRCNPDPVRRIWASNELIFKEELTTTTLIIDQQYWMRPVTEKVLTSVDSSTLATSWCEPVSSGGVGDFWRKSFERVNLTIEVPDLPGNVDTLALFVQGPPITVSGAVDPDNNGTFDVVSITDLGVSTPGFIRYAFYLSKCQYIYWGPGSSPCIPVNANDCDPFVMETGADLTLVQDIPGKENIYFADGTLTTYNGDPETDNLAPDPYIEAFEGGGNVSAHRGMTYSVLTNLDISKWAGTVPRFEADIRENVFRTIREVVDAVLARAETLEGVEFDTSELDGVGFVEGLATVGPVSPADTLRQLMNVHGLVAQQETRLSFDQPVTVLVFRSRTNMAFTQLPFSASSAREQGSDGDVHALITRGSRRDLPQEFVLEFMNADRDLQVGTSSYTVTTAAVRNTRKTSVPLTFTAHDADLKARELLWRTIYEHDSIEGTLPPTKFALQAGDRIEFTATSANPIRARLNEVGIGENGLVAFKGQLDDSIIDEQAPGGDDPPPLVTIPPNPQIVETYTLDIAPTTAAEAAMLGLQFYVAGGVRQAFPTTSIYVSKDLVNWNLLRTFQAQAVSGTAVTALPDASGYFWDTASTVEIELRTRVSLFDDDEESVASGLNWAYLGGEIIAFTTATLIADGIYELSGLLRGRNDSADAMAGHFIGEPFVLLPPAGANVVFTEVSPTFFQVQMWIRTVPTGTDLADAEAYQTQVTPSARTLQPYTVHGVWATRLLSEDLCLYATDRTRVPYRIFSALVPPQVEVGDAEDFRAEVYWDSSQATPGRVWELVRTLTGCRQADGQISFNYSLANQVTDFHVSGLLTDGSFPSLYRFLIYRNSDTIGSGRIFEFCAAGYGFLPASDCSEA